ncbi:MAG: hypothetical protein EOO74_01580 [Myxococcales bacterium]|nr:MAG: hypothetical protein EOO74_01580 [Myxococcales bacterium]
MSVLDGAPRASFDKIQFPFTSRTATLEARHFVHEFPRMAAGDVDKLGRKSWVFVFECPFHEGHPKWPGLYPEAHKNLIARAARLDTAVLVVPELGEIRCMITKLDSRRKGGIKSGEDVTLAFIEDDLTPFAKPSAPMAKAQLAALAPVVKQYATTNKDIDNVKLAVIKPYQAPLGSLLDCLNSVLAIRDQLDLYGQRVQSQLAQLRSLVKQVHDLLTPASLDPVRQALRSIWDAANTLVVEVTTTSNQPLRKYIVPRTMGVGMIAQALYGNAGRSGQLLALNPDVRDPFAIPAATLLFVPPV